MNIEMLAAALQALQADHLDLRNNLQLVSNQATAAEARAAAAEARLASTSSTPSGSERLRSQPPRVFDGASKDPNALLDFEYNLETYYTSCRITDPLAKLHHALTFLDGAAAACWRAHCKETEDPNGRATRERCNNISDLINVILKPEFLSPNYVLSARNELAKCTQTGSVTDYIFTFRQICQRIPNLSTDERLDKFVRGLKHNLALELALHPPESFKEACATVERLESARRSIASPSFQHYPSHSFNQPVSSYPVPESQPTPMDMTNSMHTNRSHSDTRSVNSNSRPRFTKLTPAERERLDAVGACHYCRMPHAGHSATDCPSKTKTFRK